MILTPGFSFLGAEILTVGGSTGVPPPCCSPPPPPATAAVAASPPIAGGFTITSDGAERSFAVRATLSGSAPIAVASMRGACPGPPRVSV